MVVDTMTGRAPRRVLVTGSRDWTDLVTLQAALAKVWGDQIRSSSDAASSGRATRAGRER